MVIYPWIRLLRLDISLLLNVGAKAISDAGALLSIPLILTGLVFIAISTVSFFINVLKQPVGFTGGIQPWMVKIQFSFINLKNSVDIKS